MSSVPYGFKPCVGLAEICLMIEEPRSDALSERVFSTRKSCVQRRHSSVAQRISQFLPESEVETVFEDEFPAYEGAAELVGGVVDVGVAGEAQKFMCNPEAGFRVPKVAHESGLCGHEVSVVRNLIWVRRSYRLPLMLNTHGHGAGSECFRVMVSLCEIATEYTPLLRDRG